MDAKYDGRDLHLYLFESRKEVKRVRTAGLVTCLTDWDGKDMGKRVGLSFGDTENPDGIDVHFSDGEQERSTFEACMVMRVVMNEHAFGNLTHLGEAAATYGGTDNKIRIKRMRT